jgi:hypothetical protein
VVSALSIRSVISVFPLPDPAPEPEELEQAASVTRAVAASAATAILEPALFMWNLQWFGGVVALGAEFESFHSVDAKRRTRSHRMSTVGRIFVRSKSLRNAPKSGLVCTSGSHPLLPVRAAY